MSIIFDLCRPLSRESDFVHAAELTSNDNNYFWTELPADLFAVLTLISPNGETALSATYADGVDKDGVLTFFPNSFIEIFIPSSTLQSLKSGSYNVHLKITTSGRTVAFIYGRLPLIEGQYL